MSDACFLDPTDPSVEAAWSDLLARSEQASPFSTLPYASAICRATGLSFRLAGTWNGDRLSGGVVLFEKRRGPYRLAVVPPITPYTSFLLAEPLRQADVTHRRSALGTLLQAVLPRYHAAAFHLHPSLSDVRPFQWSGLSAQVLYTYRQAIPEHEVLLRGASRSVRRTLKRAEHLDVTEAENVAEATAMVMHSFEHQDRSFPLSATQLTDLTSRLAEAGLARIFVARDRADGTTTGAQVMLHRGDSVYHWVGGSHRGPAKTLLVTTAMERLRREGTATIDLVGANTPSIAEFKRSFGLRLTPYYRVVYFSRPELRGLHALRPLL